MSDLHDELGNVSIDLGDDIPGNNTPLPPHQPAADAVDNLNGRKRFSRET
jgi:hypothetical protein